VDVYHPQRREEVFLNPALPVAAAVVQRNDFARLPGCLALRGSAHASFQDGRQSNGLRAYPLGWLAKMVGQTASGIARYCSPAQRCSAISVWVTKGRIHPAVHMFVYDNETCVSPMLAYI